MNNIRQEIVRFIELNDDQVRIFPVEAVEELQKKFPKNLIPGLIECLNDGNPDIRHFVVQMLGAARDNSAIPALIKRFDDDDCAVVEVVIYFIRFFGPAAAAAIPRLEGWLESPNDELRVMAAISILAIDPGRTEMKARIWEATTSKNRRAKYSARSFFGMGPADDP